MVTPYREGRPLVIDGRIMRLEEIDRITIKKVAGVPPEPTAFIRMMNFIFRPSEAVVFEAEGLDVTEEFVGEPPGTEVPIWQDPSRESRPPADVQDVFVVHGRNEAARRAMFMFLRAIGLNPLEWPEAVDSTGKGSPYIGEILHAAFSRAHAAVVLFTPDDEARLKKPLWSISEPAHETELTGQARPNVLFEAGMAMSGSPERTILVELGNLRPFTDIAGLHVIRMNDSFQRRQELAKRLSTAGCPVNLEGTDWHTDGDFAAAVAPSAQESSESSVILEQQSTSAGTLQLSEDAKDLLTAATMDRSRMILITRTQGGISIQTNRQFFVEMGNARSEARWEQVIQELLDQGLIEDPNGEGQAFVVTHKGYQIVDGLETSQ